MKTSSRHPKPASITGLVLIFLVLLVVVILVKHNPFRRPDESTALLAGLAKDRVSKIRVQAATAAKETTLEKSGEEWILLAPDDEATQAAKDKVSYFLNEMAALTTKELVSQNKDKQADFELTEDKAGKIILIQDEKEMALLVGKRTSDYIGNYIRVQNSDFVYKSSILLNTYLSPSGFK